MNFIKGIVDGILATDVDSTSKSKHQYDGDDPDYDSDGYDWTDGSKYRIHSNENVQITNSISYLSELYKSERDNCLNSLIVRYGEGCVQHLSELLKTNHETITTLSQQLQNNIQSLKEVNSKVESAAIEQVKLKNENNKLVQQLQQVSSENIGLKSQLTQADITIKSNEKRIVSLNGLLKDNKSTFENMKDRCEEFYKLKYEIEELKRKLSFSESHVSMLKKEREAFWSDPNHVLKDEDYKRRILEAFEREDRSIAVAKVMASQTANLTMPPKVKVVDSKINEVDDQLLSELLVKVEKLEDENTHLKEINDSLHTMYADLSKSMNEVKSKYLKESIESFASYFPPKTKPIQLVFVQPTGVLDLEFNPESLGDYTHTTQGLQTSTPSFQQGRQMAQNRSESFKSTQTHTDSSPVPRFGAMGGGAAMGSTPPAVGQVVSEGLERMTGSHPVTGYGIDSTTVTDTDRRHLRDSSSHQTHKQAQKEKREPEPVKKASPKLNFRSRVIKYVTNLDSSPQPSVKDEEPKLVDLDSPQLTRQRNQYEQSVPFSSLSKEGVQQQQQPEYGLEEEAFQPHTDSATEQDKSRSWNSDWDFFDEVPTESQAQPVTVSHTPMVDAGKNGDFDFILEEENELSQQSPTTTDDPVEKFTSGVGDVTNSNIGGGSSSNRSNYPESLVDDDLFDSIINEQETESHSHHWSQQRRDHSNQGQVQRPEKEAPEGVSKARKGWDDIDFDDEMFQT